MSCLPATGARFAGSGRRDGLRAGGHNKAKLGTVLLILFLLLSFSRPACSLNPASRITQYAHTAWKVGDDGLQSLPVNIAQTSDGMIWIGTLNGLFSFDGVHFRRWTAPGNVAFDENIGYLLGSRDGSLFLGTAPSGVFRLKGGKLTHYKDPLVATGPFLEDNHGDIWLGSWGNQNKAGTLCKLEDEHAGCVAAKPDFPCILGSSLALDGNGTIWIGSHEGVCRWNGNTPATELTESDAKSSASSMYVKALVRDSAGTLWAGVVRTGKGYGLLRYAYGVWASYETPEVDGKNMKVQSLLSDREGALWIGTSDNGLYRLANGRLDRFDTTRGLSSNTVSQIFEDREGGLWVVTPEGVDHFWDLAVLSFGSKEGLSAENVDAVVANGDGSVWAGGLGTLDVLDGAHIRSVGNGNGLQTHLVTYLFRDSHDRVWVAGGGQLCYYDGHRFHTLTISNGKPIGIVASMTEDRDGDLWISRFDQRTGEASLLQVHEMKVIKVFPSGGATDNQFFNVMAAEPGGGLWLGGDKHGVYSFRDGRYEAISLGEYKGAVAALLPESDGALWVTTTKGVLWLKGDKIKTLRTENGLPCETESDITQDQQRNLWISMGCGLVRIRRSEIDYWLRDSSYRLKTVVFEALDGAEPYMASTSPSWSPDGRLWFANGHKIQMVDFNHLPHNSLAPPVRIQDVTADHKSYSPISHIFFPQLTRDIEIDYAALTYVAPQKVRFRYRLDGHESNWHDPESRRQAFYNDLRPGNYTFHVIACNSDGIWNNRGTALGFTIPAAWYQTLWFKILCGFFTAALGYSFYLYRLNQYAATLKVRFDERVEERTRLAQDLHDTLLQTIQGSKLVADHACGSPTDADQMHRALSLVSSWLDRAVLEGRAALNSLRSSTVDTNDLAAAFRHAADNCRMGTTIQVSHSLVGESRDMHPIVRDEIYRIGHEAIQNACVHSGGRIVTVELAYGQDVLLRVWDDGSGIDPETVRSGRSGHFGLKGMRERAERIGAKLTLHTSPAGGTEVSLLVPGSVVFRTYSPGNTSLLARLLGLRPPGHSSDEH
jgi:ligand-binding sensor domain-containing protein